jgi:hypothetical protein
VSENGLDEYPEVIDRMEHLGFGTCMRSIMNPI